MPTITSLGRKVGFYSYGGGSNTITIGDSGTTNPPGNVIDLNSWYLTLGTYSYRYKIDGGGGDDAIFGNAGNDFLIGGTGSDFLQGNGGDDLLMGGNATNTNFTPSRAETDTLIGDTSPSITSSILAGNDILIGARGSRLFMTFFYGDTDRFIQGGGAGGNDSIFGGNGTVTARGDAYYIQASDNGSATGGNDLITGANGSVEVTRKGTTIEGGLNELFGDASYLYGASSTNKAIGGNDIIYGGYNSRSGIYGDGFEMTSFSQGGNDQLYGGSVIDLRFATHYLYNEIFGDGRNMLEAASGGNDTIIGGDGVQYNNLYGEGVQVYAGAICGNDDITAGQYTNNTLYGDAYQFTNGVTPGNDTLRGAIANGTDFLLGDAFRMYVDLSGTTVRGGDDILLANGSTSLYAYGDFDHIEISGTLTGLSFVFGNDTLTGGAANDVLKGDINNYYGGELTNVSGGNDTLTGMGGADQLTGGYGDDTFVFTAISGLASGLATAQYLGGDVIGDFEGANSAGGDVIKLEALAFGLSSTAGNGFSVASEFASVSADADVDGNGATIVFSEATGRLFYNGASTGDSAVLATLNGVSSLAAHDFVII